MPLGPGDPLPEVSLVRSDGSSASLRDDLAGEATVLVFLRHLGRMPYREHLVEVAAGRPELGRRVAVVSFAGAPTLAVFERELGLDVDLYGDPDHAAYAAFGFGHASFARDWPDPRVWGRYAALIAHGRRSRPPQDDVQQLGGDVLADVEGRIEWVYRSAGPEDRPSVARIAAVSRSRSG